jgi:hypothetical protein
MIDAEISSFLRHTARPDRFDQRQSPDTILLHC